MKKKIKKKVIKNKVIKRKITKAEKSNVKCFMCQNTCKQDPSAQVIFCPHFLPLEEV